MSPKNHELQGILEKLYRDRGFDFREYRESTLTRRLGRRLRARGAETYGDYGRVLEQDPAEYDKLFDDLTINVTGFFRDESAFKAMREKVLPSIIRRNAVTGRHVRIWSAGCATGEEPYSIAVLVRELLETDAMSWDVNITATDIDPRALKRARKGGVCGKGHGGHSGVMA